MKILIVFDSLYGNTEKIAQAIKEGLSSGNEVALVRADQASANDIEKMDLVLVGSPTHGGQFSEAVKNFFKSIPDKGLQGKRAAAFDTGMSKENESGFVKGVISFFGYASKRIGKELTKKGATLTGAETFFVLGKEGPLKEGEIERARQWAKGLIG